MIIPYDKCALLLPMNGANEGTVFKDLSRFDTTITAVSGAKTTTTEHKFYGSSGAFGGSARLTGSRPELNIPLGTPFTIGAWAYPKAANTEGTIIGSGHATWINGGVVFRFSGTGDDIVCYRNPQVEPVINAVGVITENAWSHIELNGYSDNTTRLFVNGVSVATGSRSYSLDFNANSFVIGDVAFNAGLEGYLQDFYFIVGEALHTTSTTFTPPTKLSGSISNAGAGVDPITDAESDPAIRKVHVVPRTFPTRVFETTSDSSGRFSIDVPLIESNVLILDDDAGGVYSDILISRVIPA